MLSYVTGLFSSGDVEEDFSSELDFDSDVQQPEEIRCGQVSSFLDDYGILDNELYFPRTMAPTYSARPLREGDQVKFKVRRPNESQQWKVVEIISLEVDLWDQESHDLPDLKSVNLDELHSCREIGRVINVSTRTKVVQVEVCTQNNTQILQYDLSKLSMDFVPWPGDLLTLMLKLDGTDLDDLKNVTIIQVAPLRQTTLPEAVISSWWREMKKGIIDSYIYFTLESIPSRSYFPKSEDLVRVQAIECDKSSESRQCSWRATRVVPCPSVNMFRQQTLDTQRLQCPVKTSFLEELLRPKNGIRVQSFRDLGILTRGKNLEFQISIENLGQNETSLIGVKTTGHHDSWIEKRHSKYPATIHPGQILPLAFCLEAKSFGKNKILIVFKFCLQDDIAESFSIGTQILVEVKDRLIEDMACQDRRNFGDRKSTNVRYLRDGDLVVPGQRKQSSDRRPGFVSRRILDYNVPKQLKSLALDVESAGRLLDLYPVLGEELSLENYCQKFKALIHLEEIANWDKMQEYDLSEVTFRPTGPYLALEVPGLAEKRPSLLMGDSVIATRSNVDRAQRFEGCIHEVQSKSVLLMFESGFHHNYFGEVYDVMFQFNRGPYKRTHQAIEDCAKNFSTVLFPKQVKLKPPQVSFVMDTEDQRLYPSHFKVIKHQRFGVQNNKSFIKNSRKETTSKLEESNVDLSTKTSFTGCEPKPKFIESSVNVTPKFFDLKVMQKPYSEQNSKLTQSSAVTMPKTTESNFESASETTDLNQSSSSLPTPSSEKKASRRRLSVAERLLHSKVAVAKSPEQKPEQPNGQIEQNGTKEDIDTYPVRTHGPEWLTPIFPVNKINQLPVRHIELGKYLEFEFKLVHPYTPGKKLSAKEGFNPLGLPILKWANKMLNAEQRSAVTRILSGEARPLPYIIYGPPGTGKTVTVVEAVLQIFLLRLESRILIATPSNSAADLIVERLHRSGFIQFGDLARLNAFQRSEDAIPELVRPYSFPNDDPKVLAKVARHRIVVTTCSSAGGFYKLALPEGHFTHCFLDEAGETTEPESMIPIGLLAAQIILAGDPKQLGPVLQSAFAKQYGLELSFLERLSCNLLYMRDEVRFTDHGCYDPVLVTKLVRNYRSHHAILEVPSRLFYDGDLIPLAPPEIQNRFVGLDFLPNKDCPIVFHGVRGDNYQESDSPSWFNPQEAFQTVHYFKQLLDMGVDQSDIGIISPYRKQTAKLREILTSLKLSKPKIGSVEEFQGQERDVIIVTTVRSSGHESAIASDVIRGLGFLRSEKRFNVAVTRAKSLLIVIGDPHLLAGDQSWYTYIEHCIKLKAYTGCDLPITLATLDV